VSQIALRVSPTFTAARVLKSRLDTLAQDPTALTIFTDGSRRHVNGRRRTGAGFAAFSRGAEVRAGRWGLGRRADNYDAEMYALAGAGKAAADWHRSHPHTQLFVFCVDNQAAIRSITDTTDHPAQLASIVFRRQVDAILEADANARVEIRWVPGHKGFTGNERADSIAKAATNDPPIVQTTITWAREKAKRRALKAWRTDWTPLLHINKSAVALKCTPPSLRLNPSLSQISGPRDVQSRVIHTITGHGHIGAYYARFVPAKTPSCPCGEALQTREHILTECNLHDASRHILHKACPTLSTALLLGTRKGIQALANFLKDSDALKKVNPEPRAHATPERDARESSPL
jgi:ribonuclease HI